MFIELFVLRKRDFNDQIGLVQSHLQIADFFLQEPNVQSQSIFDTNSFHRRATKSQLHTTIHEGDSQ